jgi:thiamine biosynthesis protein ThiS
MITVTFNDNEVDVSKNTSLQVLILKLGANNLYSAIAINKAFVARSNYENTLLYHGDIIQQVTPMQGG